MSSKEEFEFTFEDNRKFFMRKQDLIEISPNLYSKTIKNNNTKIIKIPNYIKFNDFNDFTEIYQSYISRLRQFNQEQSFISINLIIQNYKINIAQLIKDCILGKNKDKAHDENINHSLNINNSISLLKLSYNKLRDININKSKNKEICS